MRKDELRQLIRERKRQFTPAQLVELSLPVLERLRSHLSQASVVMAYYSLPDEVCTHELIDELVQQGKTVLLPKVLDDETMELRRYTGRHDLREGAFHIMEPNDLTKEPSLCYAIDVALIPGVAFDAQGHRLGRGRGYYDRFFHTMGTVRTLGLCFDFQKVPEVPVDGNDIPVDLVV